MRFLYCAGKVTGLGLDNPSIVNNPEIQLAKRLMAPGKDQLKIDVGRTRKIFLSSDDQINEKGEKHYLEIHMPIIKGKITNKDEVERIIKEKMPKGYICEVKVEDNGDRFFAKIRIGRLPKIEGSGGSVVNPTR